MNIPKTWKHWLYGLISAAVAGGSSAVTLVVADPQHTHDFTLLLKLAGVNAFIGVALYLKKHPLPGNPPEENGQ